MNENTNPNTGAAANGKRSPRFGASSGSSNTRPVFGNASGRVGVLGEITNTVTGRTSQTDKVTKLEVKPLKPSQHISLATAVPEPVAEKGSIASVEQIEVTNAQSVQEYAPDIHNQLFHDEAARLPKGEYMDSQTDITPKMRTILVDWLVEVHNKYRLSSETLHLTMNLIDRYLERIPVMRKRLQLVGVVAMFIASKFEEISPPELHDWVYICDRAYTKDEILRMECTMLSTLNFQIVVPTAAHFFPFLEKANGCDAVHRETAQYLLELGLLDIRLLQYKPSHVVASALLLSNELFRCSSVWPAAMVQASRQTEEALSGCVAELRQLLEADRAGAGGQLQAVHKKFAVPQRHGVSKMTF